ncbi:MAG: hypothetical protein H7Y86_10895 [Rhizobacter sp.]|nr:hypothetical protein [Ferruginibacter sp.]
MNYNSTLLTTVADCDTVLNMTNKDKSNLELRKLNLQHQHDNYEDNSVELEAELQGVIAHITALEMVIPTLPEGPTKQKTIYDRTNLENKRYRLENKKGNRGVIALLNREFDIACVEREIEEADAFITVITTRKNEL